MNFFANILHVVGSGAITYVLASEVRYPQTRLNLIAGLQIGETDSVPLLQTLRDRAISEGDSWLVEQFTQHIQDEKRHATIFAQVLKHHGKQLVDPLPPKFLQKQPNAFFDAYYEGYSPEELKAENIDWLVFLGNTYILELDANKDFVQMAKVLPEDDLASRALKKGLLSIAQDEKRHAAYLYEAMQRRLSPLQVESLVDEWRTRKVKAIWATIGDLIQNGRESTCLVTDRRDIEKQVETSLAA